MKLKTLPPDFKWPEGSGPDRAEKRMKRGAELRDADRLRSLHDSPIWIDHPETGQILMIRDLTERESRAADVVARLPGKTHVAFSAAWWESLALVEAALGSDA